jgi:hypothetical protein
MENLVSALDAHPLSIADERLVGNMCSKVCSRMSETPVLKVSLWRESLAKSATYGNIMMRENGGQRGIRQKSNIFINQLFKSLSHSVLCSKKCSKNSAHIVNPTPKIEQKTPPRG